MHKLKHYEHSESTFGSRKAPRHDVSPRIDIARISQALSQASILAPSGLSREEKREFILKHSK